jgi:hypothetical protein
MENIIAETPDQIRFFQLVSLRGRLRLENAGMKSRGPNTMKTCRLHGFSAKNKKEMIQVLTTEIEKVKAEKGWTERER